PVFLFGIAIANGPATNVPRKWPSLTKLGLLTVLFSLGWYSLGFMRAFSQPGGGDTASSYVALPIVALVAIVVVAALPLKRLPSVADALLLWLLLFGTILFAKQVFGLCIAPQPISFSLLLYVSFV